MIVCEVGLNHMGNIRYANEYVESVIKSKADGILFHIREKSFYRKKKNMQFQLHEKFYFQTAKKLKKNNIKFGITIADPEQIDFCEKIGVDFYKIFARDILFVDLIKKINKTKKKTFVSTGMSNIKEIHEFVKLVNKSKNFTLIHTQLDNSIEIVNLKAITMLKDKFKMKVGYGNHCENTNVIYLSLAYQPSDILFYVKGDKIKKHIDDLHAIKLKDLQNFIRELRELPKSLGTQVKIKMDARIK